MKDRPPRIGSSSDHGTASEVCAFFFRPRGFPDLRQVPADTSKSREPCARAESVASKLGPVCR